MKRGGRTMTKREMVDKYVASRGFVHWEGEMEDNISPLAPWLLMNIQLGLFDKYIKPLKVKYNLSRMRKEWNDAYNKFNQDFFKAFEGDEVGEVVELMDDLERYTNNDVVRLLLAVREQVHTDNEVHRMAVSAGYVCFTLMVGARTLHNVRYKDVVPMTRFRKENGLGNCVKEMATPELDKMVNRCERWVSEYAFSNGLGNVMRNESIRRLTDALFRSVIRWANN